MRYLSLAEVVELHGLITRATGGGSGIRDIGALESAIAQPKATFDLNDLLGREGRVLIKLGIRQLRSVGGTAGTLPVRDLRIDQSRS